MVINCHSHVFNLQSILTKECARVLLLRAENSKFGSVVSDALQHTLRHLDEVGDPNMVAVLFGKRIAENKALKKLLKDAGVPNARVSKVIGALVSTIQESENYERVRGALQILDGLLGSDADADCSEQTIGDFLDFIRLALLPTIDRVTDALMEQMMREDVVVPLMMDILGKSPSKRELALFDKQLRATSRQVLRYPGRILPFVKANPERNNQPGFLSCLEVVQDALQNRGCLGVKIYPSLGYTLAEIADVLKYCHQNDTPVMTHCNREGFKAGDGYEDFADPAEWKKVLKDRKKLRVCFGHAGGDEFMSGCSPKDPTLTSDNWLDRILWLMRTYPGRVFADISFHTDGMTGDASAAKYMPMLKQLLKMPAYRNNILWGTDYFLIRQRARDRNYQAFYRARLRDAEFTRLTETNPKAFLGLGTPLGANVTRFLAFLAKPLDQDWSAAGGILAGNTPAYRSLVSSLGRHLPIWNPAGNPAQEAIARYVRGQLFRTFRKELQDDPSWLVRLGDHRVSHLNGPRGRQAWEGPFARQVRRRVKNTGATLRPDATGWEAVEDAALEWTRDQQNTVAALGIVIGKLVL